jgi:hypothetical protein
VEPHSPESPPAVSAPAPALAPAVAGSGADRSGADRASHAPAPYVHGPGDLYPSEGRERSLCEKASHTDWPYLLGLVILDAGAIAVGSLDAVEASSSLPVRFVGPVAIGATWGITVGGAWLALPKCSSEWVSSPPREGAVRATWPLALSLALLAGATAPVIDAIARGDDSTSPYSTFEREMHVVAAGVAGFGGALLPYLLPPRTWAAALELERIRVGPDGRGGWCFGYAARF